MEAFGNLPELKMQKWKFGMAHDIWDLCDSPCRIIWCITDSKCTPAGLIRHYNTGCKMSTNQQSAVYFYI